MFVFVRPNLGLFYKIIIRTGNLATWTPSNPFVYDKKKWKSIFQSNGLDLVNIAFGYGGDSMETG